MLLVYSLVSISPCTWTILPQSQGYEDDLQLAAFTQTYILYSRPVYHQPNTIYFLVTHNIIKI